MSNYFNWYIRQVVFHSLVQKGVSHHIAYDAAMCAMYRDSTCVTDQPLPWGIASQEVIERLLSSSPNPYPEQIDGVEEE